MPQGVHSTVGMGAAVLWPLRAHRTSRSWIFDEGGNVGLPGRRLRTGVTVDGVGEGVVGGDVDDFCGGDSFSFFFDKGLGRTAERAEGGCVGVPSVGGILMDVMPRASGAAVKVFGPVVVAAGDQRLGEVGCVRITKA